MITMRRPLFGAAVALVALSSADIAVPQQNAPASPLRPVAVAETKLLMEAVAQPNFEGLEHLFDKKPTELQAWTFARGQALLIAEDANLLMLRPPRHGGREDWIARSAVLRDRAVALARSAAARDYAACRNGLQALANVCNACHAKFRVDVRLTPFAQKPAAP